jgi:hypothetical protein
MICGSIKVDSIQLRTTRSAWDGSPFDDGIGDVVHSRIGINAVTFHGGKLYGLATRFGNGFFDRNANRRSVARSGDRAKTGCQNGARTVPWSD